VVGMYSMECQCLCTGIITQRKWYIPADDRIKDYVARPDIINEFILMLWEAFNNPVAYPAEILIHDNEIAGDDDNDLENLRRCFTITDNPADFVSNEAIKQVLASKRIIYNISKAKVFLRDLGASVKRVNNIRGLCKLVIN